MKRVIFKKVLANSPLAYFFLSFIAMTGLSYINFLPGVVNALVGGFGFSEAQAGQIVALNGYGGIAGSIVAIFLVRCMHWQPVMLISFATLAMLDLSAIWFDDYRLMLGWRFLAGVAGGLCVGIAFSVLARLNNPDRAFGLLLFVQFSIGSLVIYGLPGLEALLSAHAVFYIMVSFAIMSLFFLLFLPDFPMGDGPGKHAVAPSESFTNPCGHTWLALLAIMSYQVAASAIWAYVGRIGLGAGLAIDSVSMYIAATGLLGLIGAMLPVMTGKRFGRLSWLVAGVVLSIIAPLLLSLLQFNALAIAPLYLVSMTLLFFSWPAVQSYLLAVTAEMDSSGRLSTIAAVVSSIGLASGPLLASSLLDKGDFSLMLYTCATIFSLSLFLLFKPVRAWENVGRESHSLNFRQKRFKLQ